MDLSLVSALGRRSAGHRSRPGKKPDCGANPESGGTIPHTSYRRAAGRGLDAHRRERERFAGQRAAARAAIVEIVSACFFHQPLRKQISMSFPHIRRFLFRPGRTPARLRAGHQPDRGRVDHWRGRRVFSRGRCLTGRFPFRVRTRSAPTSWPGPRWISSRVNCGRKSLIFRPTRMEFYVPNAAANMLPAVEGVSGTVTGPGAVPPCQRWQPAVVPIDPGGERHSGSGLECDCGYPTVATVATNRRGSLPDRILEQRTCPPGSMWRARQPLLSVWKLARTIPRATTT